MLKRSSIYPTVACLASGAWEGPASKGLTLGILHLQVFFDSKTFNRFVKNISDTNYSSGYFV